MKSYPERISISPTYRGDKDDDYFLINRKVFPGRGVEYIRADLVKELKSDIEETLNENDCPR
jgi:hypothetical protein